jgi:hypothetical protein
MKLERLSNLPTDIETRAPEYGAAAPCTFSTGTPRELSVAQPAKAHTHAATRAAVRTSNIKRPPSLRTQRFATARRAKNGGHVLHAGRPDESHQDEMALSFAAAAFAVSPFSRQFAAEYLEIGMPSRSNDAIPTPADAASARAYSARCAMAACTPTNMNSSLVAAVIALAISSRVESVVEGAPST